MNPMMIFLTETRAIEDINDHEIQIKGYNIVRCNSISKFTGGVILYVKKRVIYNVISNICTDNNWFLSIKITKGFKSGEYGVVYHSPSSSDATFIEKFENWYENHFNSSSFQLIMSDFNIQLIYLNHQLIVQR